MSYVGVTTNCHGEFIVDNLGVRSMGPVPYFKHSFWERNVLHIECDKNQTIHSSSSIRMRHSGSTKIDFHNSQTNNSATLFYNPQTKNFEPCDSNTCVDVNLPWNDRR